MNLNNIQKITIGYACALTIFWFLLFATGTRAGTLNYILSFCISLLPLVAGGFAIRNSAEWQGRKSFVGKGILSLGLGLFFWGFGGMIWSYFNFFQNVSMPYPSVADIAFALSEFCYCAGVIYLARAAGADFGLKRRFAWLFILAVSVVMFALSYYLLIDIARGGVLFVGSDPVLKMILDIAYPLGDFIGLTVAIVISGLSFSFLAKEYRMAVIALLVGLGVMYTADMLFSYRTTQGTFYNGDITDLLFPIGLALFAFGVFGFTHKKTSEA